MEFIKQEDGVIVKNDDGQKIGEINIRDYKEGVKEAYHTGVREEYGGQGIARKLVENLVEMAREEGYKIYPTCSYADKVLNEDYKDVVY